MSKVDNVMFAIGIIIVAIGVCFLIASIICWTIDYFFVFVICDFVGAGIVYAANPESYNSTSSQQRKRRENNSSGYSRNKWNGFSDPDDFPNDGYGNSGW